MKFSVAVAGLALASAFANAQQVTYSKYVNPHQDDWHWERRNGRGKLLNPYYCDAGRQNGEWICGFSQVLASQPGKPSITEYLAMFSDRYVENNGKIYAVKNPQGNGALARTYYRYHMIDGLYEVTIPDPNDRWPINCRDGDGSCVVFKLLIEAQDIGQIIAAPAHYDPIQVIGVDQVTKRIYGYYPMGSSGDWTLKPTAWGDAKDGSMRSYDWEVIGLSTNDRMFNLWGGFNNFNYGKHDDIECAAPPSAVDEWSGHVAPYRGIYCPAADDNQLWKNTWHWSGWKKENVDWARASTITRFKSGIWGISIDGELLVLWNDGGTIRSTPLTNLPNIHGVRAVGGLEDKFQWDSGVLLTNGNDEVYNVWYYQGWKETKITIDKPKPTYANMSVMFGNHNGELYMLYGWYDHFANPGCAYCSLHEVYLYHMKFVGGSERYQAIRIQGDTDV